MLPGLSSARLARLANQLRNMELVSPSTHPVACKAEAETLSLSGGGWSRVADGRLRTGKVIR